MRVGEPGDAAVRVDYLAREIGVIVVDPLDYRNAVGADACVPLTNGEGEIDLVKRIGYRPALHHDVIIAETVELAEIDGHNAKLPR